MRDNFLFFTFRRNLRHNFPNYYVIQRLFMDVTTPLPIFFFKVRYTEIDFIFWMYILLFVLNF